MVLLVALAPALAAGPAPLPGRIVSLAPGMTEILFAIGLGDRVVGVTEYCDWPPEAKQRPTIGGMSNPSIEAVLRLRPDVVVMTTDGNPKAFEGRLRSVGIGTYVFTARTIAELPSAIRDIGVALGAPDRAARLAGQIEDGLAELRAASAGPAASSRRGRVLFIVWPEPLVVAGDRTAIDDGLRMLGFENIAGGTGLTYPKFSIEEAIVRAPDYILIGSVMGKHKEMRKVSERLIGRLKSTPAVRNGRVYFTSDILYRLGPRVVEGIREMSGLLGGGVEGRE